MDWKAKKKGNAKIFTSKDTPDAIVENFMGISFRGEWFDSVDEAKVFAEQSKKGE